MLDFNREKIFGVKEVSESKLKGLELCYKVEDGQEGKPDCRRERVFRDKDGNYFMAVNSGENAGFGFETRYCFCGREVLLPITQEALAIWAEHNLYGEEYERALEELKQAPETFKHETIWLYEQGYIYEFLWKVTGNLYMLFSTNAFYPYLGYNAPYIELDEGGVCRDDLYLYYITPETARRWAEARGMSEAACQMAFER